ncbi:hypothetical protein CGZ65_10250 [Neisseria weixii]|nr:hypothetical protein CGZ65_10250 [Neisseria weixii]
MILKFRQLFTIAVILLGFSFSTNVLAEEIIVQDKDGRLRVLEKTRSNGIRTWRFLDGGAGGNLFYHDSVTESMPVRYAPTGDRSTSKVPAKLTASVSRQTVLNSAFSIAKGGARIATRAFPLFGNALLLKQAYDVVKGDIESAGYKYNEVSDEFEKYYDGAYCTPENLCVGLDSSVISALRKSGTQSQKDAVTYVDMLVEKAAQKDFAQKKQDPDYRLKDHSFQSCNTSHQGLIVMFTVLRIG